MSERVRVGRSAWLRQRRRVQRVSQPVAKRFNHGKLCASLPASKKEAHAKDRPTLLPWLAAGERGEAEEGFHQPGASSAYPLILFAGLGQSWLTMPYLSWLGLRYFVCLLTSTPHTPRTTAWRTRRTTTPPSASAEYPHHSPCQASKPAALSPLRLPRLPTPLLPMTPIPTTMMTRTMMTTSRPAMALAPLTSDPPWPP